MVLQGKSIELTLGKVYTLAQHPTDEYYSLKISKLQIVKQKLFVLKLILSKRDNYFSGNYIFAGHLFLLLV